jgi:hypothetical protein
MLFGPRRNEVAADWRKPHSKELQEGESVMGRTCNTQREDKCMYYFCGNPGRKETNKKTWTKMGR